MNIKELKVIVDIISELHPSAEVVRDTGEKGENSFGAVSVTAKNLGCQLEGEEVKLIITGSD